MAVPLQYQSQFIPTDFNTLGNVLGMFRQDMQQRNQEYDQGVVMEQMALAKLAEMETTDPAKRQELYDSLQSRIQDVVKRRGMDYGAAASDIAGIIGKERLNPWYDYDAKKLASQQNEAKLRQMWGPDYMAGRDYSTITLDDYIANPDIFTSTSMNLAPYREAIAKRGQAEAALRTQDIDYTDPKDRFTRIVGTITGYDTPEDVTNFMQGRGKEIVDDIMKDMGLEGNKQARSLLENELISNIRGQKKIDRIANREAIMQAELAAKMAQNNPYAGVPLVGVGDTGIENVYPIKGKKDFWNMPIDNSIEGLTKKTIFDNFKNGEKKKDGTIDNSFYENNKKYYDEFGSVENAKKIVDNFSYSGSVLETPVIKERMKKENVLPGSRLYYQKVGEVINELEQQGKFDPNAAKVKKEEFERASKFIDNFETKLNERLFKENSDLQDKFQHFDPFNETSNKRKDKFQDFVTNDLDLNSIVFEGSNNKDINFADLDAKDKLTDENYISAKGSGNTVPVGFAVDPKLGIKLLVKTKGKDGNWVTHIARPANEDIERLIISAYTENKPTPEMQAYVVFRNNRYGQALMEGMDTPQMQDTKPELIPTKGMTVRQYKDSLIEKAKLRKVTEEDAAAIITYLHNNYSDNIVL